MNDSVTVEVAEEVSVLVNVDVSVLVSVLVTLVVPEFEAEDVTVEVGVVVKHAPQRRGHCSMIIR